MAAAHQPEFSTDSNPRPIKRKKTLRACTYCRDHRIRCDVQTDGRCLHCLEYGIYCDRQQAGPSKPRPPKAAAPRESNGPTDPPVQPVHPAPVPRQPSSGSNRELTYYGKPLFLVYLFSSQSSSATNAMAAFAARSGHLAEPFDTPESGLLVVRDREPDQRVISNALALASNVYDHISRQVGGQTVLDRLQMEYRTSIMPYYPVLDLDDVSEIDSPYQRICRLIQCALPALSRSVPPVIRAAILKSVANMLDSTEVIRLMRRPSIRSVQIAMLLSMSDELHAQDTYDGQSLLWSCVGSGLRQAMEIGLHRNVSCRMVPVEEVNQRRVVWKACIVADKWCSLRLGQAPAIDMAYCDSPLVNLATPSSKSLGSEFHNELAFLSVLLGRVMRAITCPTGLNIADDDSLIALHDDLDAWLRAHPEPVDGKESESAELLNLYTVAVEFTFLRPFVCPTQPFPPHISFRPRADRWAMLVERSKRAILWIAMGRGWFYLDIWAMTVYPAVMCIIVQLREHLRTRTESTASDIRLAQNAFHQWARREETVGGAQSRRVGVADLIDVLAAAVVDGTRPNSPTSQPAPFTQFEGTSQVPEFDLSALLGSMNGAMLSDVEIADLFSDPTIMELLNPAIGAGQNGDAGNLQDGLDFGQL